MDITNIIPVKWKELRVLTSAQLAEAYGCSVKNISDNFNRAKEYFQEGVHYFCLTGTDLEQFKNCSEFFGTVGARTRILYLWTYQGCVRHCKMINTTKAWEMFDKLEKNYFNQNVVAVAPAVKAKPAKTKNPNRVAGQKTPAGIYAAKVGGKVKIGHSHDAKKRLPHIKGRTEKTYYQTALFPRKIARLLEWACHTIFAPFALGNELFDIEYDEACRIIKTLEELVVCLSKVYNVERDDKSLVVATKNFVEYVNLIADKIN